jgi:hypothetical protein
MKTFWMVLAAGLCAAGAVHASPRPELYLLGGPVFANLGGDGVQFGRDIALGLDSQVGGDWRSEKSTRTGPDIGVGIRMRNSPSVDGVIELRYVRRGARYAFTDASGTYAGVKARLNLDYVEIPLLAQITPPNDLTVRPVFLVGAVLSLRSKSEFVAEGAGGSATEDISEHTPNGRLEGLLGAGVRIATAPRSAMLVQLRYVFGLTNQFERTSGYDIKSTDLSLLVGYGVEL